MSDLSTFNPTNVDALFDKLVQEVTGEAQDWWTDNKTLMTGYFRSLSEASLQTASALAEGRINEAQANRAFRSQKLAFEQTLEFSEFMTLVLAQRLLDAVFSVIGWVIFNRTGINLSPHLVSAPAGQA
ncbi:hypothetical protein [Novosphingobium sp. BL-52-GroH]|uniref:hypothetical protein n=1 Tax=Novosphingobium sp. BL-52-GroH TaxID=3349877 RepID=UPI00384E7102